MSNLDKSLTNFDPQSKNLITHLTLISVFKQFIICILIFISVQDMIAILKKKEKSSAKSVSSSAVVFIQVANTSDALIGKFLQVKK